MTNQQYVCQAAKIKGLSLVKPTRSNPGIVAYNFSNKDDRGVFPCVIDAADWAQARQQINMFYKA